MNKLKAIVVLKNLRELGHIQLVERVSWSRGVQIPNPKSQILNPKSRIPGHRSRTPNTESQVPDSKVQNHEKFGRHLARKNFGQKDFGPKFSFGQKNLGDRIFFCGNKILDKKYFWSNFFLVNTFFGQNLFGRKKCGSNKIWPKINACQFFFA